MKFKSILFALFLSVAAVATATERVENATLYQISEIDGRKTLVYDGYRTAPIADDVYVSDATGEGVDSVAKLADALGKEPDWTALKLGDVVALGPASALVATVETRDGAVSAIAVTHRFARPLIGVSIVLKDGYSAGQQTIVQTLLRCGANVYLIPKIAKEEECDAYLPQLDGFVMPGGTNANPRLFGEVPYPHGSSKIDDVRDVNDVLVTRWLIAHNVPGLWICRGVQFLNVALGGGLIQDVPSYLGTRVLKGEIPYKDAEPIPDEGAPGLTANDPITRCMPAHYRVKAYGIAHVGTRHPIGSEEEPGIEENSKFLLPIVGRRWIPSVMTSHHLAADPKRIGEGLTVVAHSPDGIIEALEYQANDFALGVQFHPDFDVKSSDPELAKFGYSFFMTLLEHSRARQAAKESMK